MVVSDVYPTPTTDVADVVLPSAMWIEREGMFGNWSAGPSTSRRCSPRPGRR